MPQVCDTIWNRIGLAGTPTDVDVATSTVWGQYQPVTAIEKGEPLFPRIKADS